MKRTLLDPCYLAITAGLLAVSSFAIAQNSGTAGAESQAKSPTTNAKTWEELDVDKNGSLSPSEAEAAPALRDIFTQADANSDSMLTGEEYRNYLATQRRDGETPKPDQQK